MNTGKNWDEMDYGEKVAVYNDDVRWTELCEECDRTGVARPILIIED